jgi:hypothetical protein
LTWSRGTGEKHDAKVCLCRERVGEDVSEGLKVGAWSLVQQKLDLGLVEAELLSVLSLEIEDGGVGRLGLEVELIGALEWLESDVDGLRLLARGGSLTAGVGMNWLGESVLDEIDQRLHGRDWIEEDAYRSLGRVLSGVRDVVAAESGWALLQARHERLCKHGFRHDCGVSVYRCGMWYNMCRGIQVCRRWSRVSSHPRSSDVSPSFDMKFDAPSSFLSLRLSVSQSFQYIHHVNVIQSRATADGQSPAQHYLR